jgi:hypothetical protein
MPFFNNTTVSTRAFKRVRPRISLKSSSLLTKHDGFSEEKEWRIVYVPEGDPLGYLKACLDYFIGPRGLEPKLKYKFGPALRPESGTGDDLDTGNCLTYWNSLSSDPLSRRRSLDPHSQGCFNASEREIYPTAYFHLQFRCGRKCRMHRSNRVGRCASSSCFRSQSIRTGKNHCLA